TRRICCSRNWLVIINGLKYTIVIPDSLFQRCLNCGEKFMTLTFSRIEAGRIQAVYEPTDLAKLTTELAGMFRSATGRAGLHLVVDCIPLSEPAYVDSGMWEKMVLNLLSNAFKFTFEGEIAVVLRNPPGRIELEIRDTGTGIPADELPHIFERFHRVQGAKGRTYEGSGIGLSLVQELVTLHGGTIQVNSIVGKGTSFTISIPTGSAHLPSDRIGATSTLTSTAMGATPYVEEILRWLPEKSREDAESRDSASSLDFYSQTRPLSWPTARILLADDNADMRDYLKRLLSQQYEVEAVTDGVAALAAVHQQRPDLVLTDVMMPGLDGFGLLRELRANPQTKELPIILLSARAGEESRIEGLEAGADDYLIKPFSARELMARVDANLKLAQLRQEATQREQAQRQEAEAAKEQLEMVLSSIRDQFLVLDWEWRYSYVNDRVVETLGMPKEALLGRNIWELFPVLVGSEFERQVRRVAAEHISVDFEYFYPSWNRWFENHAYPSPEGIAIFVTEITDRKQTEELARRTAAIDAFRVSLADALRPLAAPVAVQTTASRLLGERLGANRVSYFEVRGTDYVVEHDYVVDVEPLRGCYPIASFGLTLLTAFRSGQAVSSVDVATDNLSPDEQSAYAAIQIGAYIGIPLIKDGAFVAGLAVHMRGTRNWTPDDITLAEETAERTWAAVERARAETALRASHDTFHHLVEHSPFGIYVVDADFCLAQVSVGAQKVFENVHPLIGRDFAEVLRVVWPEPFASEVIALFRQTLKTGEPYHAPSTVERRYDIGTVESYDWKLERIALPDGRFGVVCHFYDLSERQRYETVLRDREQRLTISTEAAQLGVFEWQVPEDVAIWENERLYEIYGHTHADGTVSSQDFFENYLYPEDAEAFTAQLTEAMQTGVLRQATCRIRRQDGTTRWIELNGQFEFAADGSPLRLVGVTADITARKQAEEQLRESEKFLQAINETAPNLLYIFDLNERRNVYVGPQIFPMLGVSPTDMQVLNSQILVELFHPDDIAQIEQYHDRIQAAREDDIFTIEYRMKHSSGKWLWLSSRDTIFGRDDRGKPTQILGSAIDITDRKQAEIALQTQAHELSQMNAQLVQTTALINQRNQELDQFAHIVSHDLKAPLRAISNLSIWIEEDLADQVPPDTKQNLNLLRSRVSRLEALIDGLLTYARVGYQDAPNEPFVLSELLLEIIDSLAIPPEFTIQVPSNLLTITTNRLLLSQVFTNLINNAVKHHNRPDGQIQITAQVKAQGYEFTVSDNGPGIAPQNHSKVFDIFQTLSSKKNPESTGIGLAIIKKIVDRIGGHIDLKSELGQGTTFTFIWPFSQPDTNR
ncbi:MAG: PAS domain S-box protein, partial [Acaryochloridaceae cyanobacterium RU_4_10]|nr:PAS domain S-box protein [Acaryochloridaceae cyanobacterium RU_4_10]